MPYDAKVFRAFIISPSDVQQEREAVREELNRWNARHSFAEGAVWLPVGWDTHTTPALGQTGQAIINQQTMLADCDWGIAVFWSRLGTPTENAESGSVEEIETLLRNKRIVSAYIKSVVPPMGTTPDQAARLGTEYARLREFVKQKLEKQGLYHQFEDIGELKRKIADDIPQVLREARKTLPPKTKFSSKRLTKPAAEHVLAAQPEKLLSAKPPVPTQARSPEEERIEFEAQISALRLALAKLPMIVRLAFMYESRNERGIIPDEHLGDYRDLEYEGFIEIGAEWDAATGKKRFLYSPLKTSQRAKHVAERIIQLKRFIKSSSPEFRLKYEEDFEHPASVSLFPFWEDHNLLSESSG